MLSRNRADSALYYNLYLFIKKWILFTLLIFINRRKCTGCLTCVEACPEKCIVKPKITGSPGAPVIDYSLCRLAKGKKCTVCEQRCPFNAIDMRQKESQNALDIDGVVVATGYEPFNPTENTSYGYGAVENVITGTEAEQQLADSAKITRP